MPRELPPAPEWATDAGVTLEPTLSEKKTGWPQGFQPPARWQNYWQRDAYAHLDQLHDMLLKDWRFDEFPSGLSGSIGFHDGFYYFSDSGGSTIWRGLDGRQWDQLGAVVTPVVGPIKSDGSRMVMFPGSATPHYSDDGGLTWSIVTGHVWATPNIAGTYFPNAGLWVAGDNGTGLQSADGAAWVTNTAAGVAATHRFAENDDGSIIMLGNSFSVNGGTSWAAMTNQPAGLVSYYFYSPLRGKFIHALVSGANAELYQDSGTAGDWELTPFATILNVNRVDQFFELRGTLFLGARENAGGIDDTVLLMSRDFGTTWERATSVGGIVFEGLPRGINDIADTGYIALLGLDDSGNTGVYTPPFNGDQTPLVNP